MFSSFDALLSNKVRGDTEMLVAASSRRRFEDLTLLVRLLSHCEGVDRYFAPIRDLWRDIAAGDIESDPRLRSPVFKGWLNRFGRVTDWVGPSPLLIQFLRLAPNMRHRLLDSRPWEAELVVENGTISTYDCRCAIANVSGDTAVVTSRPDRLELAAPNGHRLVPTVKQAGCWQTVTGPDTPLARIALPLEDSSICVRNDLSALHVKFDRDNFYNRTKVVDRDSFDHSLDTFGEFRIDEFVNAAEMVRKLWPEEYEDWATTMRIVVPLSAPLDLVVHGLTDAARQGACWIGARGLLPIIDALVHEQSHVKLRYIDESFAILSPAQSEALFKVGWREDPRPIEGIFEGVYVHLHVIEMLHRICTSQMTSGTLRDRARVRAIKLLSQVAEALPLLKVHANFTHDGAEFLNWAFSRLDAGRRQFGPGTLRMVSVS